MNRSGQERLSVAAGIAFFILFLVGIVFSSNVVDPGFPGGEASIGELRRYFSEKYLLNTFTNSSLRGALPAALLILFAAGVRTAIRRREPDGSGLASLAFAGGVLLGLLLLLGSVFERALIDHVHFGTANIESFSALNTLEGAVGTAFPVPVALLVGSAAIASLRFRSFPTWHGWISGILALAAVLGVLGLIVSSATGPAIFLATVLWILATSIVLLTRPSGIRVDAEPPN